MILVSLLMLFAVAGRWKSLRHRLDLPADEPQMRQGHPQSTQRIFASPLDAKAAPPKPEPNRVSNHRWVKSCDLSSEN